MEIQKNDSAKVEIQSCEVCIFFLREEIFLVQRVLEKNTHE